MSIGPRQAAQSQRSHSGGLAEREGRFLERWKFLDGIVLRFFWRVVLLDFPLECPAGDVEFFCGGGFVSVALLERLQNERLFILMDIEFLVRGGLRGDCGRELMRDGGQAATNGWYGFQRLLDSTIRITEV